MTIFVEIHKDKLILKTLTELELLLFYQHFKTLIYRSKFT